MVPQIWIIECQKMYKISNNVINEDHEKLESRINRRKTNPSISETPKRHLPEKLTIATIIRYCNDAIQ